jgi:hypothetical protein
MAFIPVDIIYTNQADFISLDITNSNIDISSKPNSVLLTKTNINNLQNLDNTNSFRGSLSSELSISNNKITINPFISKLMNIVPPRTKNTTLDFLTLPYAPLISGSLILRADGLTLDENIDYTFDIPTGIANLVTSFSSDTIFEASYLSQGILACEGTYESNVITIGDEATQVQIDTQGIDLEAIQFFIKMAPSLVALETAIYAPLVDSHINLDSANKFLKLKLIFAPSSYQSTTFPVTFKYLEDWNLAGSSFSNTILNNQNKIEIISAANGIINTTSLPVPVTLAGADSFQDTITNDLYLIEAGGYTTTTELTNTVRFAKIKPDHTLDVWQNAKSLPQPSSPYNGLKVALINGINYAYCLNNNNSTDLYKSTLASGGSSNWNTQLPLPKNLFKANLEILNNSLNNQHYIVIQSEETIYWALINNITGNIASDDWNTFILPEKQKFGATAVIQSNTSADTFYLYIMGGVITSSALNQTSDLVTKVTITDLSGGLGFTSSQLVQKLPKQLSHFTTEIINFGSDQFLYTFGGSQTSDAFSDNTIDNIYRIPLNPSSGAVAGVFEDSPNKLFTGSSGHNTVTIPNNGSLFSYVIGDSTRVSARVSSIALTETSSAIRSGTFRTGIFEIPGCDITYGEFSYDSILRNLDQSIVSRYRVADTALNLLTAPFIDIANNISLIGNPEFKLIQFEFELNKSSSGSLTELTPVLNAFSFVFTSNISLLAASPKLTSIDLTFDDYLFSSTGELIFRDDTLSFDTEYTNLAVAQRPLLSDETTEIYFRAGNTFPITSSFRPLTEFYTNTITGRFFETKLILNASNDSLLSPIIDSIEITGVKPVAISSSTDDFVYREIPLGNQDQINTTFTTTLIFAPGTLCVFVNGVEQMVDLIYTEGVDHQSFTFIDYAPDSLDVIFVNYIRVA